MDWREAKNRSHCDSSFHDKSRYDGVIIQTSEGPIFAILLAIFTVTVRGESYPLAFILPLDAPAGVRRVKDKELCLYRIRARQSPSFISTQSILRGALLAKTFDNEGDYFVVDLVDQDMVIRMRQIAPEVSHT